MSPAKPRTKIGAGNESTSVARSFPLKRRFRARISRLSVNITVTIPRRRVARQASAINFVSSRLLMPGTRCFTIIIGCIFKSCETIPAKYKKRAVVHPPLARILFQFAVQFFSGPQVGSHQIQIRGSFRVEKFHLLLRHFRFVLVIGTDDALHQMVPHHVRLVEVHKR